MKEIFRLDLSSHDSRVKCHRMKSGELQLSRMRMRILATSVWYLLASGTMQFQNKENPRMNYFTRIEEFSVSEEADPLSEETGCRCGLSDNVMTR